MDDTGTGQAFTDLIHRALRAYHDDAALSQLAPLADLRLVQAQSCRGRRLSAGAAARAVLDAGLDHLAGSDPQAAELLMRRFVHQQPIAHLAREHDYSERALFLKQRQALAALAAYIWQAEETLADAPLSETRQAALDSLPPPTFSRLFGVAGRRCELKAFLRAADAAYLVALDGMGGIGKTALARAAAEELVREGRFGRVVWITAQQGAFAWGRTQERALPALTYAAFLDELARAVRVTGTAALPQDEQEARLREALATEPTLIVVDNLETAADVRALVEGLNRLARPAKVLLTTRHRVSDYDQVTSLTLCELPADDALAFILYHASERNIPAVLAAPQADLKRIAYVTDGSPLAIKLVVGQLASLPLAQVLDDLAAARPDTHDFYRFIFRYSWERLSEPAQHLLIHMPLLDTRGTTWEDLAAVSGAALNGRFRGALEELVNSSLLNAGYVQGRLLYSIHRLTEYFILSDLVGSRTTKYPAVGEC